MSARVLSNSPEGTNIFNLTTGEPEPKEPKMKNRREPSNKFEKIFDFEKMKVFNDNYKDMKFPGIGLEETPIYKIY